MHAFILCTHYTIFSVDSFAALERDSEDRNFAAKEKKRRNGGKLNLHEIVLITLWTKKVRN